MTRYIGGQDQTQSVLFPECVDDWIDEDNPVRTVDVFVDGLHLARFRFERTQPAATGRPAYRSANQPPGLSSINGRPHAVALRFVRRDQPTGGLIPSRSRPGYAHYEPADVAGLSSGVADYCLRLRVAARPARPRPRRASVPGSGTPFAAPILN